MHRDPTLRKRNALVIPGVLLVLLCLVGIVYAQALRPDSVECGDGRQVVFANACRSATLLLVIPLALGVLLVGLGAAQRSRESCSLGHGTAATTILAVLVAFFTLPLLAALGLYLVQDPDDPYVITYNDVDFGQARILGMVAGLMGLVLLPYLILYVMTARPPRCCREKGCFEPCYCDEEETQAPIPTFPLSAPLAAPMAPNETAVVVSTPWKGSTHVAPLPPPSPTEATARNPEPATPPLPPHDSWPMHADGPTETPTDSSMTITRTPEPKGKPARSKPEPKMESKPKGRKVTGKKSK